jgi:hypothetical protein
MARHKVLGVEEKPEVFLPFLVIAAGEKYLVFERNGLAAIVLVKGTYDLPENAHGFAEPLGVAFEMDRLGLVTKL